MLATVVAVAVKYRPFGGGRRDAAQRPFQTKCADPQSLNIDAQPAEAWWIAARAPIMANRTRVVPQAFNHYIEHSRRIPAT